MKKNVLVFLAVLSVLALAPRNAAAKVNLDLGVKGGLSLATFRPSYQGEDFRSPNKSFTYGAFLAVNLSRHFAIQLEVDLRTLGFEQDDYVAGNYYKAVYKFTSISVPILAKFRLGGKRKVRPVIYAGIAAAEPGAETTRLYVNGELTSEFSETSPSFTGFASYVYGGGMEFTLARFLLILDVRYEAYIRWPDDGIDKYKALVFMVGIGF